ncbi:TPA: hypothetical protein I7666_06085 [Vibrio vulnificus]|nr:hypothetical protein [Vibrio vulnificus]
MNNYIKILGGIFATIFLGAIGSGLWERFLSPFFDWASLKTVSIISSLSNKYLDSIYYNAANFEPNLVESMFRYLILTSVFSVFFIYSLEEKMQARNAIGRFLTSWPVIIFNGAFVIVLYVGMVTDKESYNVKNNVERNIEIIRPYLSESEYFHLKSEFLRIEGKTDFTNLNTKLIAHAHENKIKISEASLP